MIFLAAEVLGAEKLLEADDLRAVLGRSANGVDCAREIFSGIGGDAWLNPKVPGNSWNMADKLLLNPKVDGFFYWNVKGTPRYGRFTEMERPG